MNNTIKGLLLGLLLTAGANADILLPNITNFTDGITDLAVQATAGSAALAGVDFNPDREGFSGGAGLGYASAFEGEEFAGALGIQYGFGDQGGYTTAMNLKGWVADTDTYTVGMGVVVGF